MPPNWMDSQLSDDAAEHAIPSVYPGLGLWRLMGWKEVDMTPIRFVLLTSLALVTVAAVAQEGDRVVVTQTLVHADSKADVIPDATAIKLEVNSKVTPLVSLTPVKPGGIQIALLIDDGLSRSSGLQLNDLKAFIMGLPPQTEVLVGYLGEGSVHVASPFTTEHAAAAATLRLPVGMGGISASPYFCLSDFVKRWPEGQGQPAKARFVMMVTNGVDPYNGSTRMANQDSPYVAAAVSDAQRAGVAVYSIYYRDAGVRGESASMSGQGYLVQVAEGTGGDTYYEGSGSPVSLAPFLKQFVRAIAESYVATFKVDPTAGGKEHLLRVKMSTSTPKLKLHVANEVRPGNIEAQ